MLPEPMLHIINIGQKLQPSTIEILQTLTINFPVKNKVRKLLPFSLHCSSGPDTIMYTIVLPPTPQSLIHKKSQR
jgi:hypothetical protein